MSPLTRGCRKQLGIRAPLDVWRWRPARLPAFDVISLTTVMTVMAVVRSLDYATGQETGGSLTLIERAFPLSLWAGVISAAAGVLVVGMLVRIHVLVFVGHGLLGTLYLAITYGVAAQALQQPAADGIRGASVLLLPVALHWTLFVRMGPKPWGWADAE